MNVWILTLILSVLFGVLYIISYKDAKECSKTVLTKTVGTISREFQEDGYDHFYVRFNCNGKYVEDLVAGSYSGNKYHVGDSVNICYTIYKNGRVGTFFDDESLEYWTRPKPSRFCLSCFIVFLLLTITILLVNSLNGAFLY